MLAIDRLRRIQSGSKRHSSLDRRGSSEVLEPASSYPTPIWLDSESGPPHSPGPPQRQVNRSHYASGGQLRRSHSGDNLYSAPGDLKSFQQQGSYPAGGGVGGRGSSPAPGHDPALARVSGGLKQSASFQPDVVAIHVNRSSNIQRGAGLIEEGEQQMGYQSFRGPSPGRGRDSNDGDATPTNERKYVSVASEDDENSSTLRRPSAKISPRISPKPKPVAVIVAKSKRVSHEVIGDVIKPHPASEFTSGSPSYSSNTLPRKASKPNYAQEHQTSAEHIYDQPAEIGQSECPTHTTFGISTNKNSAPNSPAHTAALGKSPFGNYKRAPPPPPKRTNSIKSNIHEIGRTLETPKSETVSQSVMETPTKSSLPSQTNVSSGVTAPTSSPQPPLYQGTPKTLSERFNKRKNSSTSADSALASLQSLRNNTSGSSSNGGKYPEFATGGSMGNSNTVSTSNNLRETKGDTQFSLPAMDVDSDPLNSVIEQLERQASSIQTSAPTAAKPTVTEMRSNDDFPPPPPPAPKEKPRVKLGDWQDTHATDSSDDSDSGTEMSRKASSTSLDSTCSSSSTDTNTLPFANENVGTIKQRNAANKASIVTVSGGGEGEEEEAHRRSVELNSSIFDEGTDTVKRNPKATAMKKGLCILHVFCRVTDEFWYKLGRS